MWVSRQHTPSRYSSRGIGRGPVVPTGPLPRRFGQQAWTRHKETLEQDNKRVRTEVEALDTRILEVDLARRKLQVDVEPIIQETSEKWGGLAFNAAMLRGALGSTASS